MLKCTDDSVLLQHVWEKIVETHKATTSSTPNLPSSVSNSPNQITSQVASKSGENKEVEN